MDIKWQVSMEVLSSKIDEEVILMSLKGEYYFGLDPIGSSIWELLEQQPLSINELVKILVEEYEVDEQTCREDVKKFIDDMSDKKLILQAEDVT